MDRYSRTGQVFRRKDTFDGVYAAVPREAVPRLSDPNFLGRLAWRIFPRVVTDWLFLADAIRAEADLSVFCDNSVFDDGVPAELWEALLGAPGRLVLTPRVNFELRSWLLKRANHPVAAAIGGRHPGIGFRAEPKDGQPGRRVFDYYMTLLACRRNAMKIERRLFQKEHGRDPDVVEERRLADDLQKHIGERGRLIATKAGGSGTDEALVYLAVEHAITTGKQTLVLTRDADVEEQFFKLLWLIETHYRGMLLADRFVDTFSAFRTRPVPRAILDNPNGPFEPHDAVLIERTGHMRDLLPAQSRFVAVSCWNARVQLSALSFGAEMEMGRLLAVKETTGGWSTNRLGGRNMHASVSPLHVGGRADCGAAVYDRRKTIGRSGASVAKLDLLQAINTGERHGHLVARQPPHLERLPS